MPEALSEERLAELERLAKARAALPAWYPLRDAYADPDTVLALIAEVRRLREGNRGRGGSERHPRDKCHHLCRDFNGNCFMCGATAEELKGAPDER